jgi:hypothetical protein
MITDMILWKIIITFIFSDITHGLKNTDQCWWVEDNISI